MQLKNTNKRGGFTLIEMSLSLLIVGLIFASGANYYSLYQKREDARITSESITAVTAKLSEFRNINGRYPAPASLTLQRGDADYGRENKTVCTDVAKVPGTCQNGVCIKSNTRTIAGTPTVLRVCMGTIPFRQLNLDENQAFDAYGSRLVYAVTESMTNDITFKGDQGGIEILKATGTDSALSVPASAHFIVISPGPNRAGGYTADAVQMPCPAAGSDENANCNTAAPAVFRAAQTSTANNTAQFDDTVNYFIKDPVPLWQISSDPTAKAQGDMIMKPANDMGVRIKPEDAAQTMPDKTYINGVARATDKVVSTEMCDGSGGDCFGARLLAGPLNNPNDNSGIKCPDDDPDGTGTYMVAIDHGRPVCEDEIAYVCPPGQVMTGSSAVVNGRIECTGVAAPPSCVNCCPARQTTFCGNTYTVPDTPLGVALDVYDTNGNGGAWEQWYCNNLGTWVLASSNYTCSCVPVASTQRSFPCGSGLSGTGYTYNVEIVCPGNAIRFLDVVAGTAIPVSGSCTCNPGTESVLFDCPGNTGTFLATHTHDCTYFNPATGVGDVWSPWDFSASASCPCTPGPVTTTVPCPGGSGTIVMEGTRTCPGAAVTGWHEISNTCSPSDPCDPSQFEDSGPQACPQGYNPNPTGIISRHYRDCTTGGWQPWSPIYNDCVPGAPTNYKWGGGTQLNFSPQPALSSVPRGSPCTFGSSPTACYEGGTNSAYNYSNCTCGVN